MSRRELPAGMSLEEHIFRHRNFYKCPPERPTVPALESLFTGFHEAPLTRDAAKLAAETALRNCGHATEHFAEELSFVEYQIPGFDGFFPTRCKYWLVNISFVTRWWSGMFTVIIHRKTGKVRWARFGILSGTRDTGIRSPVTEWERAQRMKVNGHPYRS